ncbi:MAG: peptide chain release factor N(5)-glutamine methyltransferase [Rhodospirillales bacterium]|nr:MAG: peptide chain release factor N(5)-glutamine methyltransferase [Rhodospirillales bacterium]
MTTAGELVRSVARRLEEAGVGDGRLEARLLLGDAAGWTTERIVADSETPLDPGIVARVERLAQRRVEREPMSHILGRREFWSLTFKVSPDVLTPRPDSEALVEAVLKALPDRGARLRVLDLGVGSGCLLLSLLHELPNATGVGIDRSERALAVARDNAAALGLADRATMTPGDWGEGIADVFDVVVSNPPYIRSDDIELLDPEVCDHEPWLALDGGPDGLDCYRRLAGQLGYLVRPGGWVALEVGKDQWEAVTRLVRHAGFRVEAPIRDLGGVDRVVLGRRPTPG